MTRFYTTRYINKHQKLNDVLRYVYLLFWDDAKKVHHFTNIKYIDYLIKNNYNCMDAYKRIVFDTVEHEEEFLKYHHDARDLRATGYIRAMNADEMLFEQRRGKWCWKK